MRINILDRLKNKYIERPMETQFISLTYELDTKDVPTLVVAYGKTGHVIDIVKVIRGKNGYFRINLNDLR
jgi:hypothetical protein